MSEASWFFALIIGLFVVWVGVGGPSHPISYAGPYLTPLTGPASSSQAYGDPDAYSSINATVSASTRGVSITQSGGKNVFLSRDLSGVYATDADDEYVVVVVSHAVSGSLSTAGWSIGSKSSGKRIVFPEGTEVPRAGSVNELSTVSLHPGDEAIVTTGRSPIGISFRENVCTGYLEEHQDFHPAFFLACPTPSEEAAHYYPDAPDSCLSAVRAIPYCSTRTSTADMSGSCRQFIEDRLTYNGCLAGHGSDEDFKRSTWRVFLRSREPLYANGHDTVTLYDAEGKIIDSLTY